MFRALIRILLFSSEYGYVWNQWRDISYLFDTFEPVVLLLLPDLFPSAATAVWTVSSAGLSCQGPVWHEEGRCAAKCNHVRLLQQGNWYRHNKVDLPL